jgi:hypothetical protein
MKRLWIFVLVLCLGFVDGATYYVSNSGNDSWSGTLGEPNVAGTNGPWKTIGQINNHRRNIGFNLGDDVYFKCGNEFKSMSGSHYAFISWNGNSTNNVTIGSYDGNGINLACGDKPIINGNNIAPNEGWAGMFDVSGDYVVIENLKVINSAALGIRFIGSSPSDRQHNGIARNLYLASNYGGGISFSKANDGLAENCEVTDIGEGFRQDKGIYNCAVVASQSCNNITFRGNKVYENYGECIGFYKGANNGLAENNTVFDCFSTGIYVSEATGNTVRYNLVYGTINPSFHRYNQGTLNASMGSCIAVADENLTSTRNSDNKVYNNLVARCNTGISIGANSRINSEFKNSVVYGNTFVANNKQLFISGKSFRNSSIKNNIFWATEGMTLYVSDDPKILTNIDGLELSNNIWSSDSGILFNNYTDFIIDPNLFKKTNWRNLTAWSLSPNDFAPQIGSKAINNGAELDSEYSLDFFMKPRGADGAWDIGAIEYGGQIPQTKTCQNLGGVCCSTCTGSMISGASDCVTCCPACSIVIPNSSYEIVRGHAVVDGYVSEFSKANEIVIDDLSPPVGLSRGSVGKYKLMWDSYGLYISGEVADDEVNSGTRIRDGNLWEDDSLEIMFDVLNEGGASWNSNDYKFYVNSDGVEFDNRGINKSWDVNFDSAVRVVDGGYVVEVAIPWSAWGVSVSENDVWGMEVAMNDRDDYGIRTQSAWVNTENALVNRPNTWGDIVFVEGSVISLEDIFVKISEWKAGRVSLGDVFSVIRGWGDR